MPYTTPKDVLTAFLTLLRAWPTEPLKSAVFRKGPQHSVSLTGAETALVMVGLANLEGGERSAGVGNNWWHNWNIAVILLVPDDEADPEGTEDTRLDLIEEFGKFLHANRSVGGTTLVGEMTACELFAEQFFANTKQVFRGAHITVQYRTLRS